jgi:hypothetical protein
MRTKNRTTSAVKATIRAFKDIEARIMLNGYFSPYSRYVGPSETPELQQLRSNRIGSAFYQKICPAQPMTSVLIKKAFEKQKAK